MFMPRKKNEDSPQAVETVEEVTQQEAEAVAAEEKEPEKPKRTRKKKVEADPPTQEETGVTESEPTKDVQQKEDKILTIDAKAEVTTDEAKADIAWHEIHNAYRTHRMLTGLLSGVEQNDAGQHYAIADYKGFRIVIPLKEMFMDFPRQTGGNSYREAALKYYKLLNSMLGAEIDFIVKGIDSKTRSVVASRTEAMLKKRQTFFVEKDANGMARICEDRIVQARVIAVAEKAIRAEVFGVDCSISAKDLSWDWIGDARDRFAIGDQILVCVKDLKCEDVSHISLRADARSATDGPAANLSLCKIQGKYAGKVTDTHKGVVFIRLVNGVNAVAHTCLDRKMPGKKDDVSFAVTGLDEERGVALGIITRIIKQNL